MICVRHRDGWCATFKKTLEYQNSINTQCSHYVFLPWGLEEREPTCPDCRKKLGLKPLKRSP